MADYLILNLVVLVVVYVVLRPRRLFAMASLVTLVILLLMTVVGDNVIILADIVAYDHTKILGAYVYRAPVEDFFYSVLAVMIVPTLWHRYNTKEDRP